MYERGRGTDLDLRSVSPFRWMASSLFLALGTEFFKILYTSASSEERPVSPWQILPSLCGCLGASAHSAMGSLLSAETLSGFVFLPPWLCPAPSEAHYFFKQIPRGIRMHIPVAQPCTWDPKGLDKCLGKSEEAERDASTIGVQHDSWCSKWKDTGNGKIQHGKSQSLCP